MSGFYREGDVVFGSWMLERKIGEGSFGQVYEASRKEFGETYKAAVKIITIPQSESEIKSACAEGMDDLSITTYFRSFVEEIVQEFALMAKLKGNSNIVSYEDHTVIEHSSGIGWDILIRMELLTPLVDYIQQHPLTRMDVIKLGVDLTKALELCQKYNIVHRDIKPENIFVSEAGDYKLGDFGIARTVEKTTGGLSKKGTYTYMAPEVYKDEPYGSSVDIYSLGLVMYRLLNENRAPFLPAYPAPITHSARESALARRISGAALPAPKSADGRLAEIVLKACAYQPKDRYSSPMQMRAELEAIQYSQSEARVIYPGGDEAPIRSERNIPTERPTDAPPANDRTAGMFDVLPQPAKGAPFASSQYDKTTSSFGQEPTAFDKTQSVFSGTAPGYSPPAAQAGPAFVPGQPARQPASSPQKKSPVWKILLGVGIPVLVFAVVFFVSRSMSAPRPSEYNDYSLTSYEPLHSFPEVSAPPLEEVLATPVPAPESSPESLSSSAATPPPVPMDAELKLPNAMAAGTQVTPVISGADFLVMGAGGDLKVSSGDTNVVRVDESGGCLEAVGAGTAQITVSYGDTTFYHDLTVRSVDPDSGIAASLISSEGGRFTYSTSVYGLSVSDYTIYTYTKADGAISTGFDSDGNLTVSLFEGEADVTLYVCPDGDPWTILAYTTVHVDSGF